jgi:hypothetical protein
LLRKLRLPRRRRLSRQRNNSELNPAVETPPDF